MQAQGKQHEAFAAVDEGKVDAFASDQLLLAGAASRAKQPGSLKLLQEELSFEPYGITLPRGDAAFRLAVNTGLAQIYRGEEISEIFGRWFARLGRPPGDHSGDLFSRSNPRVATSFLHSRLAALSPRCSVTSLAATSAAASSPSTASADGGERRAII